MTRPAPYANPYVAGTGLGLVLLAAYALAGRGLGASGAFARTASGAVQALAPGQTAGHAWFGRYLDDGGIGQDWLVLEVLGLLCGAFLSAMLARRWRLGIERGPHVGSGARLAAACLGGIAMGVGAVFARGCTSGLALTGGALLSVGSWAFMLCAFAGAYACAPLVRGLWR